jgi:MFS transporter, FHS family, L-fucose permease
MDQGSLTGQKPANTILPMAIIGLLFFIFGFVTWLNGSLIPFLTIICGLNEFQAFFVTFAFYIAYTVMAFPMAKVLERTGYRDGMALGLAIMVVGTLLFIPAALTANYLFFLIGLFVLGTGLTILQTASNPYVVLVGPAESAAMRISIMGIINKGAGVIVPLVFAAMILSDLGDTSETALKALSPAETLALSKKLIVPYLYMAGALVFLIGLVKFAALPHIEPEAAATGGGVGKTSILQFPQIILGAVGIFAYVGVEVIAGDTIGLFGAKLGMAHFTVLTSYTMVAMAVGYLLGVTCIPRFISQQQALTGSAVAGVLCIMGIIFSDPSASGISEILVGWAGVPSVPNPVMFVALMGTAHALVWPSLWPLALNGLGKFTAQGSALLIMGISGGAILPLVFGKLAQTSGDMQAAYWIGLPCYLYILFYAVRGHKMRDW